MAGEDARPPGEKVDGSRAGSDRHRQALRRGAGQRPCRSRRRARRDPRRDRGERRRQVDADEHPLRPDRARRGRDPAARRDGPLPLGARRHRRRHGHGPPGLQAVQLADRLGERHLRPGSRAGGVFIDRRAARRRVIDLGTRHHLEVDPDAIVGRPLGRRAPAGRDPEGALSRRPHPHPRRADRRPDAAGARRAVPGPEEPRRRRAHHPLRHAQDQRGDGDHRPGHGAARRPRRRDHGDARDQRRRRSSAP